MTLHQKVRPFWNNNKNGLASCLDLDMVGEIETLFGSILMIGNEVSWRESVDVSQSKLVIWN